MWVWYVSHVEKNMGRHGTMAVKAPVLVEPSPIAAVSSRLPSVQLSESIPWLRAVLRVSSLKINLHTGVC